MENKLNNSIFTIFPYKLGGQWMFDDETIGVLRESFVSGADVLLDILSGNKDECTILFSDKPFPGYELKIDRVDDGREFAGTFYYSETYKMELWLCSVLQLYINPSPTNIYIQVKK